MPVQFVPLESIFPNPFQPRQHVTPESVVDLAANILAARSVLSETLGLLQVPRARQTDKGIQLAFGHRRLAAFWNLYREGNQEYGQFPVELTDMTDSDMAVAAWSENVQRLDINPMEEARFLRRIVDEFGWTLDQASKNLSVPFSSLSNTIRLVKLPMTVQELITTGVLARERCMDLASMVDKVNDDVILRIARQGPKQNYRAWKDTVRQIHAETADGLVLSESVIEPAAQVLADALRAGEPGAWHIIAYAIDIKADVDDATDLARMIIRRAAGRARSVHEGKKRINKLYGAAGLVPPWNAQVTARVDEFVAWRKKQKRLARSA